MIGLIPFPDIGPDIFTLEIGDFAFSLRWYAMAYIVGIIIGWRIAVRAVKNASLWRNDTPPMTPSQVEDFLTWIVLGIVLGGRLGFVLFYQPAYYLQNPAEILMIWQGGMSFHGGMIGVVLAALIYCRRHWLPVLSVADMMAIATPPGLLLGRIANFINAELWGRPTDAPWGVAFPGAAAQDCPDVVGLCARHPSQLYEAGLEGLILGGVLLFLAWSRGWLKVPGQITGAFGVGYGLSRFIVEYFRQADAQFITPDNPMGHVLSLGPVGMSMGQLLSLPMIILGIALILWARRRV
ncbi:prolipoprotein diacylglyceryl transferase [Aliiroseovarius sp. YM-037]|uniref:prolipoprotein diacylglyceryl transferase n=1 Tax=Aliiroseovarius sp. YM-037 TaxID=3341728 RepID=UPI003A800F95